VRILVSAGEASGDMYAAQLVNSLRRQGVETTFFGCTGPRLREAGVDTIIDASRLSVVGLAEVVAHLPGIYREYRHLVRAIRKAPPDAAILTDSPDFHLRLAGHLRKLGVPVYYLVAPQVWAWRRGRVKQIARFVDRMLVIFPFEEEFFRQRNVPYTYVGSPLKDRIDKVIIRREALGLEPGRGSWPHLPTNTRCSRRLRTCSACRGCATPPAAVRPRSSRCSRLLRTAPAARPPARAFDPGPRPARVLDPGPR